MEENKFGKRFRNKEIQLLKWMDAKGSEGLPYHILPLPKRVS